MPLHRIYTALHPGGHKDCIEWFTETFGEPQVWGGMSLEPVNLKSPHQWATGTRHSSRFAVIPSNCVWCNDRVYALYVLRWQ